MAFKLGPKLKSGDNDGRWSILFFKKKNMKGVGMETRTIAGYYLANSQYLVDPRCTYAR